MVLSATPSITVSLIDPAVPNESETVNVSFEFEDAATGTESVGLDPSQFASLGEFDTSLWDTASPVDFIQSISLNTGQNGNPASIPTLTVTYLDALLVPQVVTFNGVTTTGNSGDAGGSDFDIAVFTFDNFNLGQGEVISAVGGRPVALLSQGGMVVAGTVDASAKFDPTGDVASGNERMPGPGGGLGGRLVTGQGGAAAGAPITGAGSNPFYTQGSSGGGGAFGGDGGRNAENLPFDDPSGIFGRGFAYGNLANAIQGGSGGGGGSVQIGLSQFFADGGGGGGGVELGALGTLTITATGAVLADGGDGENDAFSFGNANGGGGAGGGILIHSAGDVEITGALSAKGGNGGAYVIGTGIPSGGGGGGGRILVVDDDELAEVAGGDVSGGLAGFAPAAPGQAGTIAFDEAEPAATSQLYVFNVDWGDGNSSTVSVTATGAGSFTASHAYADDGLYNVVVSTSDTATPTQTAFDITVANVAPNNLVIAPIAAVDENGVAVLDLSFDDPGILDGHTVTVDWGDGSPAQTFTLSVGDRATQLTHQYLDDSPSGTAFDVFAVSVTVDDGDGGAASAGASVTVNNVAPLIDSLSNSSEVGCGVVAGQSVTLSGAYSDVGTLDAHIAYINWGDGTPVEAVPQSGGVIAASHVYAQPGIYAVSYALRDDDTGEDVEVTTTVVAGVALRAGGVLEVIGTNCDDCVEVLKQSGSAIKVTYSLGSAPSAQQTFATSAVNKIVMYLGGGNDVGFVSHQVSTPSVMLGGDGIDVLTGGHGNDVLVGGAGSDLIIGRNGNDILIGGEGTDLIIGESGSDILVSGTTAFDDNLAALDALMAEWGSNHTFEQRVANITQMGMNPGAAYRLNGDTYLVNEGVNQTVFDDGVIDFLTGGGDRDLFFASTDCGWSDDWILDLKNSEFVEQLFSEV